MSTVDIRGLDKAAVLAALYNASAPQGLGFLQADSREMTPDQARELLVKGDYFDYVYGRPLKLKPLFDNEFDPRFYDRDNGGLSMAQGVIDALRAGLSMDAERQKALMITKAHEAMEHANTVSSVQTVEGVSVLTVGADEAGEALQKAVDTVVEERLSER